MKNVKLDEKIITMSQLLEQLVSETALVFKLGNIIMIKVGLNTQIHTH